MNLVSWKSASAGEGRRDEVRVAGEGCLDEIRTSVEPCAREITLLNCEGVEGVEDGCYG